MFKKIKRKISNLKIILVRRFFPKYVINKCRNLLELNKENLAYQILTETYKYHYNNYELNELLGKLALSREDWKNAKIYFNFIIKIKPSSYVFLELAKCYESTGFMNEYETYITKSIKCKSKNIDNLLTYAQLLIENMRWSSVIILYDQLLNESVNNLTLDHYIYLSMAYQIVGDFHNSDKIFSNALKQYGDEIRKDQSGYRKIILYDNGKSRIEFYKKLRHTNQLMVTFDSINMTWKGPSFSYNFISKKNVDIIAVRKKKKQTYQQDLSQENFVSATEIISNKYQDKVAYGFSLGAYNALYYSSLINCRILSISPRLSIHPKYGRKNYINKYKFLDNKSLPYNEKLSPIVVYDPKNKVDNTYIQNEVIKQYPNAILIEIKYGSHGMAPHLLRMGQLKEFVEDVLNKKTPKYDKKLRMKSNIYFRRLGAECLKHNKHKWALNLINKSLELSSDDIYTVKLKKDILIENDKKDETITFINDIISEHPNKIHYKILLIETCIKLNKIELAYQELTQTISEFGDIKSLRKLSKK